MRKPGLAPRRTGAWRSGRGSSGRYLRHRGTGVRNDKRELVAADARDAGALGRGLAEHHRGIAQQFVPGLMAMKVVDPFEMIEVDEQQHPGRCRLRGRRSGMDQLAAVIEPGRRVGVGIAHREAFRLFIGRQGLLEVFGPAPAEQDDRDVEDSATRSIASDGASTVRPTAAGRTLLPMPTNSRMAAIVAIVVIRWLLARRTVLLLPPPQLVPIT